MDGIKIGSNTASLKAQRQLAISGSALESTFERLSSGQRINKAADDAAGISIADALKSNTRVFTQAIRNVNDGLSVLNIAQGALTELTNISQRHLELAEQAANGVYSSKQRRSTTEEANALVDEFNRIINTTEFNGQELIDTSLSELRIQAGYGIDGSIAFNIADQLSRNINASGTFSSTRSYLSVYQIADVATLDANRDGKADFVTLRGNGVNQVYLGNGDGTFSYGSSFAGFASYGDIPKVADVNRDGIDDFISMNTNLQVYTGTGNGTFQSPLIHSGAAGTSQEFDIADLNGDGILDVASMHDGSVLQIRIGNGDGTFKQSSTSVIHSPEGARGIGIADFNGDGILDIATGTGSRLLILHGNGDGTFKARISYVADNITSEIEVADLNGDGLTDIVGGIYDGSNPAFNVFLSNGDGTFQRYQTYAVPGIGFEFEVADMNKDGNIDLITGSYGGADRLNILFGNGDGSFKAAVSTVSIGQGAAISLADFNGDTVLDTVSSTNLSGYLIGISDATAVTTIARLNLNTQQYARSAIDTIKETLARLSGELGQIGSIQSRLEVATRNLYSARENFFAAESRIRDADIANEAANLVKNQVLQQASAAVLSQANQQPALAVQLLNN